MQHVHIHHPAGCTIVNINGDGSDLELPLPQGAQARLCPQCERHTWRRTPVCMHCGHDRLRGVRLLAKSGAALAALALVILHPLIRG